MKISATAISICIILTLLVSGCSEEEQPLYPEQQARVKKPIRRPVPPVQKIKPEPEKKKAPVAKPSAVEEKKISKKEPLIEKKEGYYAVQKGDTLYRIAGREDVYGDPLKWPILYRLNKDKFFGLKADDKFLTKRFPWGRS